MMFVVEPCYKKEFISVNIGIGYEIRFYHEALGTSPIGNRLSKGNLPQLDRHAGTQEEADLLCSKWNDWLKNDPQSIYTSMTRPKRKSLRKRDARAWIG